MAKRTNTSRSRIVKQSSAPSAKSSKKSQPLSSIVLRTREATFELNPEAILKELPREAMRWRYIVEHRKRWSNVETSSEGIAKEAAETFLKVGIGPTELQQLSQSTVVEVGIPYISEEESWPARILPWEFLISSVTKRMRGPKDFLVVRHLDFGDDEKPRVPTKGVFIESAPGKLANHFDFEPEYKLIQQSLSDGQISIPLSRVINPTLDELTGQMKQLSPDVIHLSAIDIRLARELTGRDKKLESRPVQFESTRKAGELSRSLDGIALRDLSPEPYGEVPAELLGPALAAGNPRPVFLGLNSWYSASRVAPLALAAGVGAALSFSTDFSDPLAETLFSNFYRYWRLGGWDILAGFLEAWNSLSGHASKLKGTGVVLWSRQSLVAQPPAKEDPARRRRGTAVASAPTTRETLRATAEKERNTDLDLTKDSAHDVISVEVKPLKRINYSLLHNNGNLFDSFIIRKQKPGRVRGVTVEVRLHVGQDSYPYRRMFDLVDEALSLQDQVRLPLTSSLIRRVDENLATTVYVCVACGGQTLYEETHRAALLPVDQWTDTDENRHWLPSFVLPRDPAVRRLLSSGQKYLMCLADDSSVGYDGYQQVDPVDSRTLDIVDLQVQSMWTALLYEHPLAYVNPPPSYEWTSQRLRTPSHMFGEGRGTCIDLALLLAACCEYVDIYPVIFLANGHAYPGYWRSEKAYSDFLTMQGVDGDASQQDFTATGTSEKHPWIADSSTYRELLNHVAAGNLVPVESTMIASRTSFALAVAEGAKNLQRKADFHSMIDIRLARDSGVTPLPLGDMGQ